jgi:hypothetical protein
VGHRLRRYYWFALAGLFLLSTSTLWAESLTIQDAQKIEDASIYKNSPGSNFGTSHTLLTSPWFNTYVYRFVIQFDLSQIPAGSTIQSAQLQLALSTTQGTTRTLQIHRVTEAWDEVSVNWSSIATHYDSANVTDSKTMAWVTSGVVFDVTSDMQAFFSGQKDNFGWMVKQEPEGVSDNNFTWGFHSSNSSNAANFPRLVIQYTPGVANTAPVADAGADQVDLMEGATVLLDGLGSMDVDGDTLTYAWTQTSGVSVTLSDEIVGEPSFIVPDLTANDTLIFSLIVNDGTVNSSPDTVSVDVNAQPMANNQTISTSEDTSVNITLTGSDPNGEALTFTVVTQPSHGTLIGTAPNLIYTPDANYFGGDSFSFRVRDVILQNSDLATVSLNIGAGNDIPVAVAGPNQPNINPGVLVTLNGTGSTDADGDALTYSWVQTSGPTVTLNDPTASQPTFTTSMSGILVFRLIVNDGTVNSDPDSVIVTVNNLPPAVFAGSNDSVQPSETYPLEAIGSDANGDALAYQWQQISGPPVTFSNTQISNPEVTVPRYLRIGQGIVLQVVASDGKGGVALSQMVLTIAARSPEGVINYIELEPTIFSFSPSSFDIWNGVNKTIQWNVTNTLDEGQPEFDDDTQEHPQIILKKKGEHGVRSCVNDDDNQESCFNKTIEVPNYLPVIVKVKDQVSFAEPGQNINLNSLSLTTITDANEDAVTTSWSQVAGAASLLIENGVINCQDAPCRRGVNTAQIMAVDIHGGTSVETVELTFPNNIPVPPAIRDIDYGEKEVWFDDDIVKYKIFHPKVPLRSVVFEDIDGDNLVYSWELKKSWGMKPDQMYGFLDAGSADADVLVKLAGTYELTVRVDDGYGGEAEQRISFMVPVPDDKEVPVVLTSRQVTTQGFERVQGRLQSLVYPVILINGVEANVLLSDENPNVNKAVSPQALRVQAAVTADYDTYYFTAMDVPAASDLKVEVFTDFDGELVALSALTVTDFDEVDIAEEVSSGSTESDDPIISIGPRLISGGGGCLMMLQPTMVPLSLKNMAPVCILLSIIFGILTVFRFSCRK